MRITIVMGFFLPVPPVQGGATEKIWFRLARHFADAGHHVTLISRTWPGWPDRESDRGLTLQRLPGCNHSRHLWLNLLLDLWWSIRVALRLERSDLVVSNNVTLPIILPRFRRHADHIAVVLGRMPKGQTRFYGSVDRVLATSQAVANQVNRENPHLGSRMRIFSNPIDWPLHQIARQQAAPDRTLSIGFVGRIHPEKGIEGLLEAAVLLQARTNLPPWQIRLVGPDAITMGGGGEAYLARLRSHYGPLLGSRVEFVPPIFDAPELAKIYGATDIFCYPTLAEKGEGLSVAPIEAMAAGAIPVLSKLDCFADLIRPGENGFYFDQRGSGPAVELAEVLARLLGDRELRARVSAAAQATARNFDYAECARRLLDDFASLQRD